MRPKARTEKHKARDYYKGRQWRFTKWDERPEWIKKYDHMHSSWGITMGKSIRTTGNKAVRRYKKEEMLPFGNTYRKIYDVQWELW